jgi:hypothetical protein
MTRERQADDAEPKRVNEMDTASEPESHGS